MIYQYSVTLPIELWILFSFPCMLLNKNMYKTIFKRHTFHPECVVFTFCLAILSEVCIYIYYYLSNFNLVHGLKSKTRPVSLKIMTKAPLTWTDTGSHSKTFVRIILSDKGELLKTVGFCGASVLHLPRKYPFPFTLFIRFPYSRFFSHLKYLSCHSPHEEKPTFPSHECFACPLIFLL